MAHVTPRQMNVVITTCPLVRVPSMAAVRKAQVTSRSITHPQTRGRGRLKSIWSWMPQDPITTSMKTVENGDFLWPYMGCMNGI